MVTALLLNQRRCDQGVAEAMARDFFFVGSAVCVCVCVRESEVTGVPEERAAVNPLLGVMMHLCS